MDFHKIKCWSSSKVSFVHSYASVELIYAHKLLSILIYLQEKKYGLLELVKGYVV